MFWNRESAILILLLFLCLILEGWLQYLSNSLSFDGTNYDLMENSIHQLHDKNMELRNNVLEQESFTTISKKAALTGFIPAPFVTP